MPLYKNLGRNSGVYSYDIGREYIIITFNTGASYEYTYGSAGISSVEELKKLAVGGSGLNSYINKHVKYKYSRKLK